MGLNVSMRHCLEGANRGGGAGGTWMSMYGRMSVDNIVYIQVGAWKQRRHEHVVVSLDVGRSLMLTQLRQATRAGGGAAKSTAASSPGVCMSEASGNAQRASSVKADIQLRTPKLDIWT